MLVELRKKWLNERCIQPPASTDEIADFEGKHSVRLPGDLRDYFLIANGTNSDGDNNFFEFFPLDKLLPLDKTHWKIPTDTPTSLSQSEYFVFADYLQSCWGYSIQLCLHSDDGGKVMTCGWVIDQVVANSFTEFMQLYLNDSPSLYPPALSNAQ